MQLVSENKTLTNQRLDNRIKEIAGLEESLEFIQEEAEEKFIKITETISKVERDRFNLQI